MRLWRALIRSMFVDIYEEEDEQLETSHADWEGRGLFQSGAAQKALARIRVRSKRRRTRRLLTIGFGGLACALAIGASWSGNGALAAMCGGLTAFVAAAAFARSR
jgi:hypothetical protein